MFNYIDVQIVELIKENKVTIKIKHNGEWQEITRDDFMGVKSFSKEIKRSKNGSDN